MDSFKRVFIAEADPSYCEYLRGLVQQNAGYDVIGQSDSGNEALRSVERLHPDILLLDLVLRETDGMFVLETLSNAALIRYPRIAVITALAERHKKQILSLGADICLKKPLDEALFWDWLRRDKETPSIAKASLHTRRGLAEQMLDQMGMSRTLVGFDYLVEAVALASCDHRLTRHMMSELYPNVARQFETTVPCVERAVRRLIEDNWTNGRMNVAYALFGYSVDPQRGKPTNGECVARLAEYVHFALAGSQEVLHVVPKENGKK